jgi:hypothetical protein
MTDVLKCNDCNIQVKVSYEFKITKTKYYCKLWNIYDISLIKEKINKIRNRRNALLN